MEKLINNPVSKSLKMLSLILTLTLLPMSNRMLACDGSCSCKWTIQIGGFIIYSEHHEYWGSGSCCTNYGATLTTYIEMDVEADFDVYTSGSPCCGRATAQCG